MRDAIYERALSVWLLSLRMAQSRYNYCWRELDKIGRHPARDRRILKNPHVYEPIIYNDSNGSNHVYVVECALCSSALCPEVSVRVFHIQSALDAASTFFFAGKLLSSLVSSI